MLGFGANMLLFFSMFVLLAEPHDAAPLAVVGRAARRARRSRSSSSSPGLLLASTQGNPAFQAFGIALIVLIWINYFSRVVLYAAAWAHTSRGRARRPPGPDPGPRRGAAVAAARLPRVEHPWAAPYVAGAATMLGLVAVTALIRQFSQEEDMKLERKHGWLLRKTPK